MRHKRSGARLWLLAFIGFSLLHAGWAFAAPYDGPPDEQSHALRANGLWHGDVIAGDDYRLTIARSLDKNNTTVGETPAGPLVHHTNCFPMQVFVAADCAAEPGGDESTHRQYVSAARYNPVYYAVAGWPLLPWPNWTGVLLTRVITGMLVAALLAFAVVGAARWTRHRAVVAGLVVAITPMTAHLAGSINPNGVEIAAAAALFTALIALVHDQDEGVNRAAVVLACVSAAVLVTPRFLGAAWLLIILIAVLIPSRKARLKELFRSRALRIWTVLIVVAGIASLVWTRLVAAIGVPTVRGDDPFKNILKIAMLEVWPNVVNQMVGVMGWAETLMPRLIYVVWFMAAGLLILGGLALGRRADRLALLVLMVGTFVPLLAIEVILFKEIGFFNQGRYFLAGAIGLPMLGAAIMARRGITAEQMRAITRMLALLLVPIQMICLAYTMTRWQSGLQILNPLKGSWTPPAGSVVPLVLGALGCVVLFATYWQASRIPVEVPPTTPDEDEVEATPELQTTAA